MITPELARTRSALVAALRDFFSSRDYLEVDPPVMARTLIPESHIEVFETYLVSPYDEPEPRYLTPSPEVFLKQLLAAGYGSLFSIGKAFRNSESTSRLHHPEFTMLEWYGVETDAQTQTDLTGALLQSLAEAFAAQPGASVLGGAPVMVSIADVLEAEIGIAGTDLTADRLEAAAADHGIRLSENESAEDLFHRLLVDQVEPALPSGRPVFLVDYPAFIPTLAAVGRGNAGQFADRWELYVDGMELANCYTEERDPAALEKYVATEGAKSWQSLVPHEPAQEILGFANAPPVSGVALGVDRLLMALTGMREIEGVIFFP